MTNYLPVTLTDLLLSVLLVAVIIIATQLVWMYRSAYRHNLSLVGDVSHLRSDYLDLLRLLSEMKEDAAALDAIDADLRQRQRHIEVAYELLAGYPFTYFDGLHALAATKEEKSLPVPEDPFTPVKD